ncbi:hypothetical protein [Neoroseomonas soli]|uniref:Uncharacterized protein n=1 Tax=Neoroseomonas soli TaxID=1081025 RepID=A0A9X9X0M0_9PROT|nr:hypothetical protein [Neoroseomonas soli]MBR0672949.1 hypothetical protein [Neoroseomonas soli]
MAGSDHPSGAEQRLLPAALALAIAAMLVPPLAVPLPPLLDYPNHLARLSLIAGQAARPPLDAVYVVDWSRAATNIGIDLLALAFGPAFGAEAVGRIGILFALLLPVLGALALGRVVAGRWHVAMLATPLFAWTLPLAAGFLNHQIAVGLALLAAAGHAALRHHGPAPALLLGAASLAIAVVHLFGAAFLIALAGATALGPVWPGWREWGAATRRVVAAAGPAVIGLGIFLLLAPTLPGDAAQGAASRWHWTYQPALKAAGLLAPFVTYDLAAGMALALLTLALCLIGLRGGWIRFHAGLGALAAALFLGGLVLPSTIGDTEQIEIRLACAGMLAALVGLRPGATLPARAERLVVFGLLAFAIGRSAWTLHDWRAGARDIAAVERALAALPRGATLLPVEGHGPGQGQASTGPRLAGLWPLHVHYGLRAVVLRDAFVPGIFAFAGKQPLRLREPWRALTLPAAGPPPLAALSAAPALPLLQGWRHRFGHVLVLDAPGMTEAALPAGLELVAVEGFARLYRVVPQPGR